MTDNKEAKMWLNGYLDRYKATVWHEGIGEELAKLVETMTWAKSGGRKVFFAGNGASNTIASHAALDFMNQHAVKTVCMNDPGVLTCFGNDFGYDEVFARYIKIYAEPGDVAVLVSSSGMSRNVVEAAKACREKGVHVVTLTGFNPDNDLKKLGHLNLWLDSSVYNIVECTHMVWLVAACDYMAACDADSIGLHGRNL